MGMMSGAAGVSAPPGAEGFYEDIEYGGYDVTGGRPHDMRVPATWGMTSSSTSQAGTRGEYGGRGQESEKATEEKVRLYEPDVSVSSSLVM